MTQIIIIETQPTITTIEIVMDEGTMMIQNPTITATIKIKQGEWRFFLLIFLKIFIF